MEYGSLYDLLHQRRERLGEPIQRKLAMEIAEGVAYLHGRSLRRGDIPGGSVPLSIPTFELAWTRISGCCRDAENGCQQVYCMAGCTVVVSFGID